MSTTTAPRARTAYGVVAAEPATMAQDAVAAEAVVAEVVEAAEATDLQPCLRFDEVDDGRRNFAMHGLIEDVVMRARKLQEL